MIQKYYAQYNDQEGTAELCNGSGYLFRRTGERRATLVSYKDGGLVLCGRCDLADSQQADDTAPLTPDEEQEAWGWWAERQAQEAEDDARRRDEDEA